MHNLLRKKRMLRDGVRNKKDGWQRRMDNGMERKDRQRNVISSCLGKTLNIN